MKYWLIEWLVDWLIIVLMKWWILLWRLDLFIVMMFLNLQILLILYNSVTVITHLNMALHELVVCLHKLMRDIFQSCSHATNRHWHTVRKASFLASVIALVICTHNGSPCSLLKPITIRVHTHCLYGHIIMGQISKVTQIGLYYFLLELIMLIYIIIITNFTDAWCSHCSVLHVNMPITNLSWIYWIVWNGYC